MSDYDRAHYRVKKLWGPARQYPCIRCGGPARDWAYDHTDPTSEKYSVWPEFYMPMCHACHLGYDGSQHELFEKAEREALPGTMSCRMHGCAKLNYQLGYCSMHYHRIWRYGGPGPAGMIGKRATLEDRFTNNVQVSGPIPSHAPHMGTCYIWTGYVHQSGYGAIGKGNRLIYVHRLAYERAYGPIPQGMIIEQVCRNKLCVRPDHLVKRSARP